jgi:hypothetical protein
MKKDLSDFAPLTDEDYADSSNVLEIITLWDRLSDLYKTDKLRSQIKAIAGENILSHLINEGI